MIKIAVLARPVNLSFELDKDKSEAFFRSNKRGMVNKAIKRVENHNIITHDHSIVAIQDTFNEHPNRFLVYDDVQWKCKLFINYRDNMDNYGFIKKHLSRELKVDSSSIAIKYIPQMVSKKISGRDNILKTYCHNLVLARIENIPEHMRTDTFECDGRTYHWNTINDLENDNEAMEKNSDIIHFVKENI